MAEVNCLETLDLSEVKSEAGLPDGTLDSYQPAAEVKTENPATEGTLELLDPQATSSLSEVKREVDVEEISGSLCPLSVSPAEVKKEVMDTGEDTPQSWHIPSEQYNCVERPSMSDPMQPTTAQDHDITESGDDETSDGEELLELHTSSDEEVRAGDGEEVEQTRTESQPVSLQSFYDQFLQTHTDPKEEGQTEGAEASQTTVGDSSWTEDSSQWSSEPPVTTSRNPLSNVYTVPPTQALNCSHVTEPVHAYELFVSDKMISRILKYTNQEGERVLGTKWQSSDMVEMRGLVGILLLLGLMKQNMVTTATIWDQLYGTGVVRASLSRNRFMQLMTYIRFDDKETRSTRRAEDAFAPFRRFWEEFMCNLLKHYSPGPFITLGEQLVPFRGRCSFLQYAPTKVERFGMKIFWAVDSENNFPLFALPYLGKERTEKQANLGRNIALRLASPFYKSGRNITCDSFFTDLELSKILLKNDLTLVGTVKRNKKFLPESFREMTGLPQYASSFAFLNGTALVNYQTSRRTNVVVLSTMHSGTGVEQESGKNRPDMVTFFNSMKGAVDTMNRTAQAYSTKRKTQRWPMVMFFNVLDLGTIAARCIWMVKFPGSPLSQNARTNFIQNVAEQLMIDLLEQIKRRLTYQTISANLRETATMAVSKITGEDSDMTSRTDNSRKRKASPDLADDWKVMSETDQPRSRKSQTGRCGTCNWRRDKKTTVSCDRCKNWVCKDHVVRLCHKCAFPVQ